MVKSLVLYKGNNSRLYWNLSSNVGAGSPNLPEDVLLVQFAFYIMANNPKVSSKNKPIYAAVPLDGKCSGRDGDPLIAAIRTRQRDAGGTQDGKVSVIKGSDEVYDKNHAFLMVVLNNNLFDAVPNDFPRIDKHPRCPPQLRDAIKRCCQH